MVTANASRAPGHVPTATRQPVGTGGRRARDARVSARRGISTMFPPSASIPGSVCSLENSSDDAAETTVFCNRAEVKKQLPGVSTRPLTSVWRRPKEKRDLTSSRFVRCLSTMQWWNVNTHQLQKLWILQFPQYHSKTSLR